MANLAALREDYDKESHELHLIFEEAGPTMDMAKVKRIDGTNEEKARDIDRRNDLLADITRQIEGLEHLGTISQLNDMRREKATAPVNRPTFSGNGSGGSENGVSVLKGRNLREFLVGHKGYRDFREGRARTVAIDIPVADFKTLITLSNISPQNQRLDLVTMALEERTIADLCMQGATDRPTLEYYEETTVTNAAAAVSEGGTKPESALGWTLRTEPVRKIATWIPATQEALDDVPFLESQIRGRLTYMVQRVEETEILSGTGGAPHLVGLTQRSGIQTQAKAADPTPDAIYKAMQKIRGSAGSGFAEPTAVIAHPNDWTDVKLLRTADGIYIWGNPSDEGPDRIWGKPIRQTTAITEGTMFVGAFRPHAEVIRREGITITLSTEHSTYFVENKVAILAESRLGLACYRPSAFATVTGV